MKKKEKEPYVPKNKCLRCNNPRYYSLEMEGLCLSCYYESKVKKVKNGKRSS